MDTGTGEATPDRQTLTVSSSSSADGAVVELSGDLDFETAGTLRDLLGTLVLGTGQRLTIDLGAVDFFDSSGLGTMLAAHALAKEAGAVLELRSPPDHVLRVLEAVGLTDYFFPLPPAGTPSGRTQSGMIDGIEGRDDVSSPTPRRSAVHPESEALAVTVTQQGRTSAVVAAGGELDMDTATLLHHQLAAQVTQGRVNLVLDLAGVPFMDSSGLNIVLRAMSETRQLDGCLLLASPTDTVRRLLDLTGVSLTSKPFDTVEQALASLPAEAVGP